MIGKYHVLFPHLRMRRLQIFLFFLQNILEYEGDVETDMFMSFQISVGEYGKIKTVDLKVRPMPHIYSCFKYFSDIFVAQLQYWELSLTELKDSSSLGLELVAASHVAACHHAIIPSTSSRHRSLNSSVDRLPTRRQCLNWLIRLADPILFSGSYCNTSSGSFSGTVRKIVKVGQRCSFKLQGRCPRKCINEKRKSNKRLQNLDFPQKVADYSNSHRVPVAGNSLYSTSTLSNTKHSTVIVLLKEASPWAAH